MALEELIARLERDAQARVAAIEAQAGVEVEALTSEAGRRREEGVAAELAARRALLAARLDGELAQARRRSRSERLVAEHAAIDRVLARARELVDEVGRTPEYAAAVARHATLALRYVEGLAPTVRVRPELAPALRGVAEKLELDPALGVGVVVAAADGSVIVDETLGARLNRFSARLAMELKRELTR